MSRFFYSLPIVLSVITLVRVAAAEEFTLPPIVKEASPVDVLDQDPVYSTKSQKVDPVGGSGSLLQNFEDKLPFAVTDPGRPGGLSQFRGLGASAEDTNVQSLGIPLNYAQGGGFDFSSLPQYLWSSFKVSPLPSFSALDPRGVAGSISLVPWTQAALEGEGRTRFTGLYSDADLVQISAATKVNNKVAVLAGNSSGQINGPSGEMSARVYDSDSLRVNFHLLATDVNEELYNFGNASPATFRTIRMLPVMELDAAPSQAWAIKSSAFYDNLYTRSDNFGLSSFTRDRAQQLGAENALVYEDWKLGFGARHVSFVRSGTMVPEETITHGALSRTLSFDSFANGRLLMDPVIQEVSDTGFDATPAGSLGLRQDWGNFAVFARGLYTRRFPSLSDRYYTIAGAAGNPALKPENDVTGIVGVDARSGGWSGSLQGYYQVRDNAKVGVTLNDGFTIQQQNQGQARIATLLVSGSCEFAPGLILSDAFTWNHSRIDALRNRFPLLPDLINVTTLSFVPASRWAVELIGRAQSDQYAGAFNAPLSAAAFGDAQVEYEWSSTVKLTGRIENFSGTALVLDPGYPPKGRVFVLAVAGEL